MKAKRTSLTALVLALALVAGCGSQDANVLPPPPKGEVVGGDIRRADPGQVDTGELVAGLNGFGLDFLRLLAEDASDENVVFSPLSIGMAFGMAEAGARGETAQQIADVFGFPSTGEDLDKAFNALDQELSDSGKSTLRLANRLYPRVDFRLYDEYVRTLAAHYGAPLELLDLKGDREGSRQRINSWVAERTKDRIEELLKPGFISSETVLILVNAVYLEARWAQSFSKKLTDPAPFTKLDGSTVDRPLMRASLLPARYVDSDALQAVELPYSEGGLSMLVLIPAEGEFEKFERGLDSAKLARIDEQLRGGEVDVALPRWTADFDVDLVETLPRLGLTLPFLDAAEFTAISPDERLKIEAGVHAANIEVDETGTIAAAATGIGMMPVSGTLGVAIRADRPFIYLICDTETGTILFAGRVLDPTADA